MDVSKHFILGLLFSLICFLIFPHIKIIGFLLIFLSSFLIDFDHFLYYFYKNKDLSIRRAYKRGIENRDKCRRMSFEKKAEFYAGFFILHGIEILFILILLTILVSKYFLFIFVGFAFHLLLDCVHQTKYINRIDKFCLLYDFKKFKKLKFIEDD